LQVKTANKYVEKTAHALRKKGLKVFYDSYEEASLWGKDLYTHLRDVYQNQAEFTVIFISGNYNKACAPRNRITE